jgi:YidC/Oxa1 family membrane protein insertase
MPIANILQPLIDVFDAILVFFHDHAGLSWGTSIIALTIVVRLLILPLAVRQFHSMQGLQKLAPEMKALQEKYRDDKQRLNQEMMKLYQEHKVNPFGSCLPLVLQMPVFFSLFYMLRSDLRLDICNQTAQPCDKVDPGSASWFFVPDITDKATGGTLLALLILYVGSQLLSGVLMSVTADRNQRLMIIALPVIFVPFILTFPAGLLIYWITTNIWTIGQQTIIRKRAGMPVGIRSREAPAPAAAAVASPKGGRQREVAAGRDGKREAAAKGGAPAKEGAPAQARRTTAPPPPPRRKKKQRSGRRR